MTPERRLPVLMAFCGEAFERTTDDAIEIYDRALGGADRAAQRKREELERRASRDTQARSAGSSTSPALCWKRMSPAAMSYD